MQAYNFMEESNLVNITRNRGGLSSHYIANLEAGDFVLERLTNNGQFFIEMSIDPLIGDHESILSYERPVSAPFNMVVPFSISQRARNTYFTLEAVDIATSVIDDPLPINIASISQATTTLTVVLTSPTDIERNEWFSIYGLVDTRLNYTNACVATVSANKMTLTCTVVDDISIASLTISAVTNSGSFQRQKRAIKQANGIGQRFSGITATSCALLAKGKNSNVRVAGTMAAQQLTTTGSTTPVISNGGNNQVEIKASTVFDLQMEREQVSFLDYAADSYGANSLFRQAYDISMPDTNVQYTPQLRATSPKSMSLPIAKIVSVSKTGTTTATITTNIAHGLVAGNIVDIHGIRDQTNFANQTAMTVIAVPTATTFTVIITTSATATSYSGMVVLRHGSADITGRAGQAIQSVTIDVTGIMTLVGSATWTGLNVGEYVNLYGVRNNTNGGDMGLDGVYKLIDLSTTIIKLIAVTNLDGSYVKNSNGVNVTPTLAPIATTNCGGSIFMRTTARMHDLKLTQFNHSIVKIDGQGENRIDKSLPVAIVSSVAPAEGTPYSPSTSNIISAASTNATSIKTTSGKLYSAVFTNYGAAAAFVKLYNKATAPTVGTDVPLLTITIPANSDKEIEFGRMGLSMTVGVALAITNLQPITDATAVAVNQVTSTITYV